MEKVKMALLAVVCVAVLWAAGEQHQSNCLERGRTGCTVLPWSGGHQLAGPPTDPKLLREARQALGY